MADNKEKMNNLPLTMLINKVKKISMTVEKNMEFIFVLKGKLNITINNQHFNLEESDVVLINNGDVYEIEAEGDNLVLSMQIEYESLSNAITNNHGLFLCNSSINDNEKYDSIRKILARLMYMYSNRESSYEFEIMSLIYKLLYIINENFLIVDSHKTEMVNIKNSKYNERISNILMYIKQNFNQPISLQDVADSQYLTPEYLSKFFKAQMGMNFSTYLNEIRLDQAVKELLRTDNSITKVAMNNGFPNAVALNKLFKEVYNTTPAEYRNQLKKKQLKKYEEEKSHLEVTNVDYNQAFEELKKFIDNKENLDFKNEDYNLIDSEAIEVNVDKRKTISHSWKNLINLGYASDGLRSDLQHHLTDIQNTIKFRYVRFQGIFSDEMLIDSDDSNNRLVYNFSKIDKLIDFLYSIGLKPFIELGDKAKILNLVTDKVMYFKKSTRKRTFKESLDLLEQFIVHCVNRYGVNEVSDWYFEIWKEGDRDYVFWSGDFEKYLDLFQNYSNTIKRIVPNAKIGGPGLNPDLNMKWLSELLNQWKSRAIKPDFFSVYLYPYELIEDSKKKKEKGRSYIEIKNNINDSSEKPSPLLLSRDRCFSKTILNKIRKVINEASIDIPELHVTEYNSSISHRHPANDTTYKSSFIVKNVIDNLDEVNSFGYWLSSDISGELKDADKLLYGDMGLISANGIKKPGFYAYEMLSKLGNDLIQKGDGYIVTKKFLDNYEVITYNYKHFDYFYCLNEDVNLPLDQYYNIFEDAQNLKLNINLKGVKRGRYRIKKYTLNREHGSIFDEWLNMNTIRNIRKDEINYLKQICVPKQTVTYLENADEIEIESNLSPHEVNLYEIIYEYN